MYFCCDTLRREATRQSTLNGIDFIEVIDDAINLNDKVRDALVIAKMAGRIGMRFSDLVT